MSYDFLGGRILDGEGLPAGRLDPLSIDQNLVLLGQERCCRSAERRFLNGDGHFSLLKIQVLLTVRLTIFNYTVLYTIQNAIHGAVDRGAAKTEIAEKKQRRVWRRDSAVTVN